MVLLRAHAFANEEKAMGKHRTTDVIEAVIWLVIAIVFFAVSFEFNQPIEIYKFGATGWPRVILALMAVVAFGNFYHSYKKGAQAQTGRVGASEEAEAVEYKSFSQYLQTGWLLILLGSLFGLIGSCTIGSIGSTVVPVSGTTVKFAN